MIHVYIHYPNMTTAKKISKILLKNKLAACVNFIKQEDMYWWQGKIENTNGVLTLVATRKNNYKKIETLVKKLHPFKVPCILELPVKNVLSSYRKWLYEETK